MKEKEWSTPAEAEIEGDRYIWWYVCGECHSAINWKDEECRECKRPISWAGLELKRAENND
jgi:ribosomal protein L40E